MVVVTELPEKQTRVYTREFTDAQVAVHLIGETRKPMTLVLGGIGGDDTKYKITIKKEERSSLHERQHTKIQSRA